MEVARGSMTYKHHEVPTAKAVDYLNSKIINLKLIPDIEGEKQIARLVISQYQSLSSLFSFSLLSFND